MPSHSNVLRPGALDNESYTLRTLLICWFSWQLSEVVQTEWTIAADYLHHIMLLLFWLLLVFGWVRDGKHSISWKLRISASLLAENLIVVFMCSNHC